MNRLPAYCGSCHLVFPSVLVGSPGVTMYGNAQTCPNCGAISQIADFINGISRLYPKQTFSPNSLFSALSELNSKLDEVQESAIKQNDSMKKLLDQFMVEKTETKGFFSQLFHSSKSLRKWTRKHGWKALVATLLYLLQSSIGDDIGELVDIKFPSDPFVIQFPKGDE